MWVSVRNTFLDTECLLDMQASPRGGRRARSAGPGGCRERQALTHQQVTIENLNGWDSEVFCSGYSAEDRAKWAVDNCGLSFGQARLLVMSEFPTQFRLRHGSGLPAEQPPEQTSRLRRSSSTQAMKSMHSTSLSTILEDWDCEEFCDGHSSENRAKWMVENWDLSLEEARLLVMQEFPMHFGRQRQQSGMSEKLLSADIPEMKKSMSDSSLSTMCPDDWIGDWDAEEFCDGHPAEDRAKWVVENCGLSLGQARLRIMGEFPTQFGRPSRKRASDMASGELATPLHFVTRQVPKVQKFAEEFHKTQVDAPPTTLMLRNVPNRYTQKELIDELNALGFTGSFDFFYLPMDFGSMGNVGYSFINFVNVEWAAQCQKDLDGHAFKKHQRKVRVKLATFSVAHLQGLEANLRHYERTAVMGGRSKRGCPVVLTSVASATMTAPQ